MVAGLGAHTAHALDRECVCVGVGIFWRTHVSLIGRSVVSGRVLCDLLHEWRQRVVCLRVWYNNYFEEHDIIRHHS